MAKSNLAIYTQNKRTSTAICTAAKTTYNDAANAVLIHTAGADGDLVRRITAVPRATVTATQLQLYRSTDGGTTLILCGSVLMPAYTMSQTTAVPVTDFGINFAQPLGLAPNERLYVGIGVALAAGIAFTVEAEGFVAGVP
ncbi:hypothetical protein [Aureimonas pseudogalii]|uniref:Uncharacterized protein n=1 Tax=Aureimonas pseudogalii TaxID=1744844 RepID=A0A7W6H4D5_9HYPH|nr:hypothetical protein [Aureimonas pseudogalii]MBB3996874.1 hypothetical protein [Aureimonas pseudogalii]